MKPRLYKHDGLWHCRSLDWPFGDSGRTPAEAYHAWVSNPMHAPAEIRPHKARTVPYNVLFGVKPCPEAL